MAIASSEWVKLRIGVKFRRLIPQMSMWALLAGSSIYWTQTELRTLLEQDNRVATFTVLKEQLNHANAEVTALLAAEKSGTLNEKDRMILNNISDSIKEAQTKTKSLTDENTIGNRPERRSDVFVPIFGITSAYAASEPAIPEKSSIFDRQTRIVVMFIVLAVIVAITASCFAILFVSSTADTVTFAKDTLKAAGGFYFGIMNAFLGTT